MKIFLLTLCLTAAAFAAPPNFQRVPANGNIWDFQSSVLDDFEANLRRMRDEFDQLEKSLESRFKFPNIEHSGFPSIDIDGTGVRIFENGTNIFDIDPSNVKNKTVSDTKIVDDKVVHTEEKVIANGNSVVHFRTVQISPKDVPSVVVHSSSNDDDDQPPKTPSSSVPEVTPSKNDVDSEHVDNDDNSYHPSRDVEEIDNVEPLELRVVPEVAENDLYGSDSNEHRSSVVDLSGDTKVNDILSEKIASGALLQPEPDAEIIEFDTNNINNNNRFANDNVAQKPAAINDNNRFYYHYEVDP